MSSVDIIVPCYRYAHFLRQCIESVLAQSFRNLRVLIVDDASPDNTAEIASDLVNQDSRVTLIRHPINRGHIETYNEGIEWAVADYTSILSADDYLLPGALRRVVGLLDTHPEVGFAFGKGLELCDATMTTPLESAVDIYSRPGWRILEGSEFIELSGARNIVTTPTVVVRTALQKRLGGYRPELPHAGDMEMWLRFSAHASVGVLESYQAVYRRHSSNMSLEYTEASRLPDLQQRKAVFEVFFNTFGAAQPNGRRVKERVLSLLARDAIGLASAAFNRGEIEYSHQLLEFARDVCPAAKTSLPWIKLALKRRVGRRAWNIMEPLVARIRDTV